LKDKANLVILKNFMFWLL